MADNIKIEKTTKTPAQILGEKILQKYLNHLRAQRVIQAALKEHSEGKKQPSEHQEIFDKVN